MRTLKNAEPPATLRAEIKNIVNGNATMLDHHVVRHMRLPLKSVLQVAVLL